MQEFNDLLKKVMSFCNNHFVINSKVGVFTILGGRITLLGDYLPGMFILITGSRLNDAVFKITAVNGDIYSIDGKPIDEVFTGIVYALSPPRDFMRIISDIYDYNENIGEITGVISENNDGYSYKLATNKSGAIMTWHDAFTNQLVVYRRISKDI
jgi:hypothetical protein